VPLDGLAGWKPALPRTPLGRMAFPGGLVGAVGDPEKVIELLRMARVGVIGAFVLVLDIGAGGLHGLSCFACGVGGTAVDWTTGSLWKGPGGEG
jgi:hypothetical protein